MKRTPTCIRTVAAAIFLLGNAAAPQAQTLERPAAVRESATPSALSPPDSLSPRRHIVSLRAGDTAEGARVSLTADVPLDDYSAYRAGDRFYLLIPRAEAATQAPGALAGRSFSAAHVVSQQGDVLLSFQLQPGAQARVSQKFNRLDIIFTAGAATAVVPISGAAQGVVAQRAGAQGDDHELIQQLLRRIEELEGQVKELRAGAANNISAPAGAAQPPVEAAAAEEQEQAQAVLTEHEHEGLGTGPRLQIQGFADVNYRASDQKGATNAFSLGQLDLFITSRLSERFSVLSELVMEARRDNSFDFEIHRLLLRYTPNDYFNLSIGRYHTAIGFFNNTYHHGSWFQTAANRPFVFAFEGAGGPLPLHNVGLSATGRIPSGSLGLRYVAEVGNGRSARASADRVVQTAFDENNGKSFNLGLQAKPDWLPGFKTGFSFYRDRLTPVDRPNTEQMIMAGYAVYQSPRYEWLNEAVFIRHKPAGTDTIFYTPAFYTQFARRFGKTTPYFRYQYFNAPDRDPFVGFIGRRNGPAAGVRYDVTQYAAFKAQYERTQRRRLSPIDELILQLAFTF